MLRNMNVEAFGRPVHLFSYPGITIGQLIVQIKNDIMPPPRKEVFFVSFHNVTSKLEIKWRKVDFLFIFLK